MDSQRSGFDSYCADHDNHDHDHDHDDHDHDHDYDYVVQTVEILRRPGQTLGFYIREGNGVDQPNGVFISRIATGSVVESNDLLRVMDEILAVDKIDVQRMSLDDVAILMSIPKRLVLTIRRRRRPSCPKNVSCPSLLCSSSSSSYETEMNSSSLQPPRSTAHQHHLHPPQPHPHHLQQQHHQQPVYVRKGRIASVGDVPDHDDDFRSSGVHFRSGGSVNPGFRLSMDVARSLSLRGQRSTAATSGSHGRQDTTTDGRRLKDCLPRTRERAVDILDELIGQQQRQWRRSHRWQDNRKLSVDSTGSGSCVRRRVDYSSDSDAQLGSDHRGGSRVDHRGASTDRLNQMSESAALYNGNAFSNEAILDRSGLVSSSSCLKSLSKSRDSSPERYCSDSEVGRTSTAARGSNDRSLFGGRHSSYVSRLFGGQGARCNTLPQKFPAAAAMSAATSVNSDELKHWLQKLDNLAFELEGQQKQQQPDNKTNITGSTDSSVTPSPVVGRRCRTLSASSETECYTAEEYRSWIDRQSPSTSSSGDHPPASSSSSAAATPSSFAAASRTSRLTNMSRKLSADSLLDYHRTYHPPTPPTNPVAVVKGTASMEPQQQQQEQQRRLFPSFSSTWKSSHRPSSSSSASKSSLAVAAATRSRHLTPSPCPGGTLLDPASSFPQGPSKPLADRRAASSILKDLQAAAKKPIQLRTEDFVLYPGSSIGPEDSPATSGRRTLDQTAAFDGSVYVHIFCGHGLKASRTMLRDLYCVVAVDAVNKARTMIRTGAINFDWDEDFELDVISARRISFLVYSWDPTTKHQLCFSAVLSLQAFLRHRLQTQPRRLALRLDPKGILYVELVCLDPGRVFQRLPADQGPSNTVFGVALETLARRDAAPDNIPIVVRRCIEEIERRGLNHVGLYRLCGSAKRKQQLRTDFEAAAGAGASSVDLSPQSISDINVITGVLKDFLQQLPEPIFTTALYQMLLDAISVRIPEDPDGSSRLMFSVLDCLPKTNQDVVAFLLSHLKRVARKSETNKMDSSSLATCFGPLTLCPPYQTIASTISSTNASAKETDFRKQAEVLRYIIDIWPEEKADGGSGGLSRSPFRGATDDLSSSSSSSLPIDPSNSSRQGGGGGGGGHEESNPAAKTTTTTGSDCSRTTTTAIVHSIPPKTSFC